MIEKSREARRSAGGVDRTILLEVNGTRQRLRLCAGRAGLPPILIVQAGPGFPLLNEVEKFQRRLGLEEDFTVAYWDQRACGPASSSDVQGLTLTTQVDDLCVVLKWLQAETTQQVVVLGISLGATVALRAAARAWDSVKALVLVSIDVDTTASDVSTLTYLQDQASRSNDRKMATFVAKLGPPPYTTPSPFQLRARMLADLGVVERGKRFSTLLLELLPSLIRTYGLLGALRALRNMNSVQRRMLPELAELDLLSNWPRRTVPTHYIFGGNDPLVPASIRQKVSEVVTSGDSMTLLPDAGHMAHFDEPVIVRSMIKRAHGID